MATYKDLLGPDGTENNMGGTRQFFHFAPHADILTFGAPAASPSDPDDKYNITIAHVMKSGKKFNTMYCTIDTSELELGSNGEIDGKSFKPTFKFFYPGSKKDAIAFANQCKNDKFVFLVPLSDGTIVQIGGQFFVAYITPNFKTGATSGRGKGWEFEVMAYQPEFMVYTAAVPLTPAA
ncbi:hypothetical protein IC229_05785 [Spirosoma sp. BT702]|uniref:Uncharacterized protein n=1 Tax=Spirosoma profusum TaxID=2771354 RepID=A0A927AQD4_9BACT|nr:hypothetical protein [Spirosoma profusum]MBD2700136.1 hypothetical protein [Spirosoma profusum]